MTLAFPSAAMIINIYNVLMLFKRFSREEAAAAQLLLRKWHKYMTLPPFNKVLKFTYTFILF